MVFTRIRTPGFTKAASMPRRKETKRRRSTTTTTKKTPPKYYYRNCYLLLVFLFLVCFSILSILLLFQYADSQLQSGQDEEDTQYLEHHRRHPERRQQRPRRERRRQSTSTYREAPKPDFRRRSPTTNRTTRALTLPKPVIVVGFPKAGTSSIFEFFHRQGLRAQHWYCCRPQRHPQQQAHGSFSLLGQCLLQNLIRNSKHTNQSHASNTPNQNQNDNIFRGCDGSIVESKRRRRNRQYPAKNYFQPPQVPRQQFPGVEIFTEINSPRTRKVDPKTKRTGFVMEDGTLDVTTVTKNAGGRIFLPQHFHLEEIHAAYPQATWILNRREPAVTWADSVIGHNPNMEENRLDLQFANEYYAHYNKTNNNTHNTNTTKNTVVASSFPVSRSEMVEFLVRIYHEHLAFVRAFVADHPTHTLVEVIINHPEAGTVLGDAFGLDPTYWQQSNKRGDTTTPHHQPKKMKRGLHRNRQPNLPRGASERRRQNGTGRRDKTKYPKVLFFVHVHKSAGTLFCDLVKRNNLSVKGNNCNIQTDQHCCGNKDHISDQITYANTTRFDLVAIEREMYTAMAPDQYDYIVAFRKSQARYYSHWRHLRSIVQKSARTRPGTAAWLMHDNTTLSGLQYIQEQHRVPTGQRRARARPNTNTIALLGTFQHWIQYQPDNWK